MSHVEAEALALHAHAVHAELPVGGARDGHVGHVAGVVRRVRAAQDDLAARRRRRVPAALSSLDFNVQRCFSEVYFNIIIQLEKTFYIYHRYKEITNIERCPRM